MLEYDRIDVSKELMLITQMHKKNVISVMVGIF